MTTATAEPTTSLHKAAAPSAKGRIGLVVLGAIASGLSLGLVHVLAVFAGGREHEITGAGLLPSQAGRAARAFAASPRELWANLADLAQLPRLFDEAKVVKSLGGRPLAVVTATVGNQRGWRAAQDRLAKLSTNSVQRTVAAATHTALLEDERFAAIASRAITQVVQHARSGRR